MKRFFVYSIGTGFGTGFTPFAPGTAGSLLALIIYFFLPLDSFYWLWISLVFFFAGVWAGFEIEKERGKDPGLVVIDEMVGQWLAVIFLPPTLVTLLIGFALFRVFDIFKPYPINRSQKLKGGWGIMVDDMLAGIYANIIIHAIYFYGLIA
ncbi:MAG: phosphatidylglycerophosphatase A [Calditrichaceae bacterium]|nr:phosphatidylglycerophosphatase A [Calditrichaceae bacterium]